MNPAPSLKVVASSKPRGEQAADEASSNSLDVETMRSYYRWGGHLSTALVRIRSKFDGDLDQCLLYLIFLLAELSEAMPRGPRPPQTFRRRRGLNALSLAEITQIPRETARRKLLALVERGYLVREGDGLFTLGDAYDASQFFDDLKPLLGDTALVEK
ncbi:MAG: hypothetical protein V4820_17625 [Pseudomonadota bacterium]|uniref:hypothetical protein n=1 Tax=Phenylobacterium sp. TaxID=1871053 RepID=UPI00271FE99A|nr:hypothetical protein [Phenylobacterium sp.]MDO9431835.1 hypothetical protein [Phenylobacterium sp.]